MYLKTKFFLPVFVVGLITSSGSFGQSYNSYGSGTKVETRLHQAIEVDVQTDLKITFLDATVEKRVVKTSDSSKQDDSGKSAAIVRVIGGSAELMVDIQEKKMEQIPSAETDGDDTAISLYDFNIVEDGAGDAVTVMPFANDDGFVLTIGGTVEGGEADTYYEAVNLLNVNYL